MTASSSAELRIAGETLWLLADRAIYWPAEQALLIADLHIGKAATYRHLGQPVPHGTTARNLQRLDRLLADYPSHRLIVLGDFFHARPSRSGSTLAALRVWRQRHPGLQVTLVRGNHDRAAGDPPAELHMEIVDEPLLMGPFALCHEPQGQDRYVLAGHLHPVFVLRGRGRERLRMPCFSVQERLALLPAFGEFTGGMAIEAEAGRSIYGVAEGQVWKISAR